MQAILPLSVADQAHNPSLSKGHQIAGKRWRQSIVFPRADLYSLPYLAFLSTFFFLVKASSFVFAASECPQKEKKSRRCSWSFRRGTTAASTPMRDHARF